MALDEISSGRIPNTDSAENTCCKLPGAEFLSTELEFIKLEFYVKFLKAQVLYYKELEFHKHEFHVDLLIKKCHISWNHHGTFLRNSNF